MADMYLYNGVKLPKLPEWAIEKYTNACILGGTKLYVAVFAKSGIWKQTVSPSYGSSYKRFCATPPRMAAYFQAGTDEDWRDIEEEETGATMGYPEFSWSFVWCNKSFSSYKATEPVPVLDIDHTAMVQGWIVGKRLAAIRSRQANAGTSVLGRAVLGTMILGGE